MVQDMGHVFQLDVFHEHAFKTAQILALHQQVTDIILAVYDLAVFV